MGHREFEFIDWKTTSTEGVTLYGTSKNTAAVIASLPKFKSNCIVYSLNEPSQWDNDNTDIHSISVSAMRAFVGSNEQAILLEGEQGHCSKIASHVSGLASERISNVQIQAWKPRQLVMTESCEGFRIHNQKYSVSLSSISYFFVQCHPRVLKRIICAALAVHSSN